MKKHILLLVISFIACSIHAQNFALNFDGTDNEVRLANESNFIIGDAFTIEAWINATEWRQESWQGSIVGKDQQGPDSGYAFRCGKGGTLSFVMSVDNAWVEVASSPIMEKSVWNHVAVVIDNGKMTLFINGDSEGSVSFSGTYSNSDLLGLKVGASGDFEGRIFNGAIDEVRIWNIVKTGQELFDNSTEPLTGSEAGLIAYLPFDEGTGSTTANLANPGNPGTLIDMVEADWVGGAELSGIDLGVTDILNPNLIDIYERPVEAEVEIKNFGNEAITEFDLTLFLNNTLVSQERVVQDIASGEKITYTFAQFLDATDATEANVSAVVSHPGDSNSANDSYDLSYEKPNASTLKLFDQETHNFGAAGQTQLQDIIFPFDMQDYSQILMHIDLECPSGGCDPWDQPAKISVINDGTEYEIARYITPYGIACGPWTIDITDFKSILGGTNQFKSYVQVWGASGWNMTADIELIKSGAPTYHKLTPLWQNDYLIYGDPNISHDLDEKSILVDADTESTHMRMTITGHGQANTDNAAEFSPKTHQVIVNDDVIADHYLWKDDCEFNTCDDQAGNWLFDRAGWCPGEAVNPYTLNLTNELRAGFLTKLDYELELYTNLLNTGYNGGSHTEPHYRIHSFLIEESSKRYSNYRNLRAESLEVMVDGTNPTGPIEFTIVNNGTVLVSNPIVQYYINGDLIFEEAISGTIQPGDTYVHQFSQTMGFVAGENDVVAHINYLNDQNIGDDFIKTTLSGIVSAEDVFITEGIDIYPNPSDGFFDIQVSENITPKQIVINNVKGQMIQTHPFTKRTKNIFLKDAGVYTIKVVDIDDRVFIQRVVVF